MNAIRPRITILIVLILRNDSALVEAPTDVPSKITTMYIRALLCCLLKLTYYTRLTEKVSKHEHTNEWCCSWKQCTNNDSNYYREEEFSQASLTGRRFCILIARSFFVVNNFIIGGWMIGTNAMYEYAATAIGPIRPV